MNSTKHQSGVALIVVLLVVTLAAVLATEMGSRLQLQVKRIANIKDANQAYWYAMGAEQYARKSIQQVLDLDSGVVHLGQPWNQEFIYPLDGGGIQAQLKDMQACFNLNAVNNNAQSRDNSLNNENDDASRNQVTNNSATTTANVFYDLLTRAELEIDSYTAETLRDSLIDWLDEDDNTSDFGAEDGEYESRIVPYLAANSLMANKSELRMVNGADPKWLTELMPMLCAVPDFDQLKLNINTIDAEHAVILAAVLGKSAQEARDILSNRPPDGYEEIADFFGDPNVSVGEAKQEWFDTTTSHFILYTKTRYNNATFNMTTVFKVSENKNVSVVRREFGGII